jgi:hypothetical protein
MIYFFVLEDEVVFFAAATISSVDILLHHYEQYTFCLLLAHDGCLLLLGLGKLGPGLLFITQIMRPALFSIVYSPYSSFSSQSQVSS